MYKGRRFFIMYELLVTEEFIDELKKLPSNYLVILISQIEIMNKVDKEKKNELQLSDF